MLAVKLERGGPNVAGSAWVAPNATLAGPVTVRPNAGIFYGAVLRAELSEIVIGERSNIQDNVVIHVDDARPAIIGDDVSVGHSAILHGCRIDEGCLIGMGSIIMNGAHIGAHSLVAAGALVLEDFVAPAGSLIVGAPARVRRALREDELAQLRENPHIYQRLIAQHSRANEYRTARSHNGAGL